MKFNKIFFSIIFIYLFYIALNLTNGYLPDFFEHINAGSTLFANMWEHFRQGNFFIDPANAYMEYFVLDNNKFTVYFGFFPAFIRGFFGIFLNNIYKFNLNNLSILLAHIIAIFFLYRTFLKLDLFNHKTSIFSIMFFVALFLASPVAYISAWGWMYNEALIWGFAWVISYISVYLLWTFKPQTEINAKNGALMGLCLSMAVLSRAIDAIIPLFSFVFIVFKAFFDYFFKKNPALLKSLLPGIFLCFIFCGFALKINFEKWGNPLVFQQFEKNIQVIQNPERLDGYKKYGLWNFNRLPTSFLYYFVPSAENFKPQFPFIDVDRELTIMKNRSYYDLIMASRVPLSLSSLYLLFFALIGAYKLLKLDKKAIIYLIPLLLSGILQYTTMLIYGGLALRYSLGFIFLIVILNLIFLFLESQKQKFLGKSIVLYYSVILLFISIYINFYTMLAYKHSIPNISPNTRYFLGKIINYIPDENHLRFIKNNTLYEKIKPVTIIETKKRD